MIPSVDPQAIAHSSERSTYIALRDGLSKKFVVFHSYPWLRPDRGRDPCLREGEADFVIVHPEYGLLVLEVKGGNVGGQGSNWYRQVGGGKRESIKNPFLQARENMHTLINLVADNSSGSLGRGDYVYGYAVVFPHTNHDGPVPPDADKAIIICERDLPTIQGRIEDAYKKWTSSPRPLSRDRFDLLVRSLQPQFRFITPIGPAVEEAAERIHMLTETQAQVYQSLLEGAPRVLVEGVAGSGKTELAFRSAANLAKGGKRALFVCFNKELASWLRERRDSDPALSDLPGRLDVDNYHALAARLAREAKVPWRSARGMIDAEFWRNEVADIVDQSVDVLEGQGRDPRYDAIVVDEAQDFEELWWLTLTETLLESPESPLQVFLDPNQSLFGEVKRPEIGLPAAVKLSTNCRNTKRVAEFSAKILDLEAVTFRFAPDGEREHIVTAETDRDQRDKVEQRVKRLLGACGLKPQQIALLGPAAKDVGSLADLDSIAGVPLVTSGKEWRSGGGLLVATARSFKGLEAPAVVVYDVSGFGDLFTESDLYVACTRAVYLLEVIVRNEAIATRLRQALKG